MGELYHFYRVIETRTGSDKLLTTTNDLHYGSNHERTESEGFKTEKEAVDSLIGFLEKCYHTRNVALRFDVPQFFPSFEIGIDPDTSDTFEIRRFGLSPDEESRVIEILKGR